MFTTSKFMQFTAFMLILVLHLNVNAANTATADWSNLSPAQYVDKRVACKTTLDELKWSYNLWPKENKTAKPLFADVVDRDQIRQSVQHNLKMQALLADRFNFKITPAMLQHDMDRMASNTKDSKRLRKLYAVLNNNPTTIAECISRPYLVQKKLANQYNYNHAIHAEVKATAQADLDEYLHSKNTEDTSAQVHTITFKLKQDDEKALVTESVADSIKESVKEFNQQTSIELDATEFKQKLQQLNNKTLQEKASAFIYTEVLSQSEESISVQVLQWQKQSQNIWLNAQPNVQYAKIFEHPKYTLTAIKPSNQYFNKAVADILITEEDAAPTARSNHTAIWSGSEMIVWGGGLAFTGGRYNPGTDSWTATSTINAPAARSDHTAIWSGSHMIVWGGTNGSGYFNTGSSYNPGTDSWTATSTTNAPTARSGHTAIWSGSHMIVWGGWDGGYSNTGSSYNPSTGWTATSATNAPTARRHHTAIWTGSHMIVWGGRNGGGYFNTGSSYNPSTGWTATSATNAPAARGYHTAIWSGSHMIVWGGLNGSDFLNTGSSYNPSTGWTATSATNAPAARNHHTAIWTGSHMIVWGGWDLSYLNTGSRYNPSTGWTATSTTNAPTGRYAHTAIWTGTEMIVWGGQRDSGLNTGGRYNAGSNIWTATRTTGELIFQNGFE